MNTRRIVILTAASLLTVAPSALGQTVAARPTQAVPRDGCVTTECHANVRAHAFVHGPVNVNACDACHTITSEQDHTFALAREAQQLCMFCHEMNVDAAQTVHEPLLTGDCLGCHDPHGGANRAMLQTGSPAELCRNCHEDVIGPASVAHGPVAAGACIACHQPHASTYRNLLNTEGRELCLQCHVSVRTQVDTMRVVHGPVNVDCAACHDAHASNHAMMLHDEPQKLCASCHESIQHIAATATTQHAAVTTEQGCLNCHDAHASNFPRVLKSDMMTLCFECHDREIEMPDGRMLADIKAVIDTGTSLHGPVAQRNCATCHEIHGGGNFRLLVKEYPPEFYAPFREESYALCFSCHDRQLVHDARTTSLTNFRNGDTNLHFLHVNREKKGRTCRACHETHASNKANHIRESVPFGQGGWKLPIQFEKTETGGGCAPGCHVPYKYDRTDPEVYPRPAEPASWPGENQGAAGDATGAAPKGSGS